jgi:hypothetical protein
MPPKALIYRLPWTIPTSSPSNRCVPGIPPGGDSLKAYSPRTEVKSVVAGYIAAKGMPLAPNTCLQLYPIFRKRHDEAAAVTPRLPELIIVKVSISGYR